MKKKEKSQIYFLSIVSLIIKFNKLCLVKEHSVKLISNKTF